MSLDHPKELLPERRRYPNCIAIIVTFNLFAQTTIKSQELPNFLRLKKGEKSYSETVLFKVEDNLIIEL